MSCGPASTAAFATRRRAVNCAEDCPSALFGGRPMAGSAPPPTRPSSPPSAMSSRALPRPARRVASGYGFVPRGSHSLCRCIRAPRSAGSRPATPPSPTFSQIPPMPVPTLMANHVGRRCWMHRASAKSVFENCLAPSGRCLFRTIIRASSIGGPMRPTRIASPRIPAPDRTRRAAPGGKGALCCKALPPAGTADAACTRTIADAAPRRGIIAPAKSWSRAAASIASTSAASQTAGPAARPFTPPREPAKLAATVAAAERLEADRETSLRQWRVGVERASYEASRAERRYRAVDPDNRLVARGLEREWEERLSALEAAKAELLRREEARPWALCQDERSRLLALGADLAAVWHAATTTQRDRKELLRALLEEVIVKIERDKATARLTLRWKGGALAEIDLALPRSRPATIRTDEDTIALVRRLAALYPDAVIAGILNRQGRTTAYGHRFEAGPGGNLRRHWDIPLLRAKRHAR